VTNRALEDIRWFLKNAYSRKIRCMLKGVKGARIPKSNA